MTIDLLPAHVLPYFSAERQEAIVFVAVGVAAIDAASAAELRATTRQPAKRP